MEKSIFILFFISMLLMATSACQIPNDSKSIKVIGGIIIGTGDGNAEAGKAEIGSVEKSQADKSNAISRKDNSARTSDNIYAGILPPLESIEDVFKALGVWEKASYLHESGLSWGYIARNLGYSNMYVRLQKLANERLKRAVNEGLITRDQSDMLFKQFDELAKKWSTVILLQAEPKPTKDGKVPQE